jgi:phosphoglycerate dehydrogenase-like enzyme
VKGAVLVSDGVEARYADRLEAAAPGVPRVVVHPDGPDGDLSAVKVAYFSIDVFPHRSRDFLRAVIDAKGLEWFHTMSAGVDDPFFQGLLDRGIRLTTSSGAQAVPIAHTVMLYLLALSRDLRGWLDAQERREWRPRDVRDLQGRSLAVIGLGPIGLEVARLGAAFGMEVTGFRRSVRGDEPCRTEPVARLADALPTTEYLVVAAPLTDETRGLIDAAALRALPREAVIVNNARGELIDEAALIEALERGEIAGAALDVFETEPLPEASRLWSLPNVIVTPHSSGTSPGNFHRATEIFLDNLARYVRGEGLRNEVMRESA